jgi:hypothetical protein
VGGVPRVAPSASNAEIQAGNARLAEVRAHLRKSQPARHGRGPNPQTLMAKIYIVCVGSKMPEVPLARYTPNATYC